MQEFYYSFAITMLHSVWQMAVLLLFTLFLFQLLKKLHPSFKRNVLYLVILLQVCISIFTFLYYHNEPDFYKNLFTAVFSKNIPVSWAQQYAGYLFYTYSFMVLFRIGSLINNCIAFKNNYTHNLLKPGSEIRMFTISKAHQFGIKRKVQIWFSNCIDTPLTYGFLKPVILLPIALINNLNVQETETLIVHELTHIKNNDYLWNWLLLIAEAIYFFNPFVRIAAQKINLEKEKSCDTQVIHFKYSPLVYAQALLKIETQKRHSLLQLGAITTKQQLLKRIRFFSNQEHQKFSSRNSHLSVVALLSFVFIGNILLLGIFKNDVAEFTYAKPVAKSSVKSIMPGQNVFTTVFTTTTVDANRSDFKGFSKMAKKSTPVSQKTNEEQHFDENKLPENYNTVPVALKSTADPLSKQVEISEETSSGKTITQVYKVELINGKWLTKPLYMTTEIKIPKDSIKLKTDSSFYQFVDDVQ